MVPNIVFFTAVVAVVVGNGDVVGDGDVRGDGDVGGGVVAVVVVGDGDVGVV